MDDRIFTLVGKTDKNEWVNIGVPSNDFYYLEKEFFQIKQDGFIMKKQGKGFSKIPIVSLYMLDSRRPKKRVKPGVL